MPPTPAQAPEPPPPPPLRVLLFLGSTRPKSPQGPFPGRVADRVAAFVRRGLEADASCVVDVVDPADEALAGLAQLRVPFHWAKATKQPVPAELQRLVDQTAQADAFVFASPEYNFSASPAILSILNHLPPAHYGGKMKLKPVLLVTYSMNRTAGARALAPLGAVAGPLGCVTLSQTISLGEAHVALTPDGAEVPLPKPSLSGSVTPNTDLLRSAHRELVIVGRALRTARAAPSPSSKL